MLPLAVGQVTWIPKVELRVHTQSIHLTRRQLLFKPLLSFILVTQFDVVEMDVIIYVA
jgi:hypothetical protein